MSRTLRAVLLFVACCAGPFAIGGCHRGTTMRERELAFLTDGSPGEVSAIKAATIAQKPTVRLPPDNQRIAIKHGDWHAFWNSAPKEDAQVVVQVRRTSQDRWIEVSFARPILRVVGVEFADDETLLIDVQIQSRCRVVDKLRYAIGLDKGAVLYAIPYVEVLKSQ